MPHYKNSNNELFFLEAPSYVDLLPDGCVLITDEEADAIRRPNVDEIRDRKWQEIKAKRDDLVLNGGFRVDDKWYHSDEKSRIQQLGLLHLGVNIPDALYWKTMDSSFILMTAVLINRIFAAAIQSDTMLHKIAEEHRAALNSSEDSWNYDFSGRWPTLFPGA